MRHSLDDTPVCQTGNFFKFLSIHSNFKHTNKLGLFIKCSTAVVTVAMSLKSKPLHLLFKIFNNRDNPGATQNSSFSKVIA